MRPCCALSKVLINDKRLYKAPEGDAPPPFWIRCLLILTCTGVSFAHGSNDGQKGMGLIMLILIGTVPTAYALNHAITPQQTADFVAVSQQAAQCLDHYITPARVVADPRDEVTDYVRTKEFTPNTDAGAAQPDQRYGHRARQLQRTCKDIPQDQVRNFRNDMYLVSEALRIMKKSGKPRFHARTGRFSQLQKAYRLCDQVYPNVGEGCRGAGTGPGHHDGLEAYRGHGRRENRQGPPDLRPGRGGRNHRHG